MNRLVPIMLLAALPNIRRATVADVDALIRLRLALLREAGNLQDEPQIPALTEELRQPQNADRVSTSESYGAIASIAMPTTRPRR